MKPRFTISTIAILTAYAAIIAAAVAEPISIWQTLGMFAPIPILGVCFRVILTSPGPRRWFAAGMMVGTVAYAAAIVVLRERVSLPHEWISDAIWGHPAEYVGIGVTLQEAIYRRALLAFQFALVCGVGTGCLTLLIFKFLNRNARHA
ncbi:MAG: hypothetical protein SGJ19_19010 [Planctomycetia bacterium]|nr:hypothetical protein [Planctomycetia bacterium]